MKCRKMINNSKDSVGKIQDHTNLYTVISTETQIVHDCKECHHHKLNTVGIQFGAFINIGNFG